MEIVQIVITKKIHRDGEAFKITCMTETEVSQEMYIDDIHKGDALNVVAQYMELLQCP